jgi:PadR family transcriptional regulator PadR
MLIDLAWRLKDYEIVSCPQVVSSDIPCNRRSYRSRPMADRPLGQMEFAILMVLINQSRDAYGATIQERLEATTGRDYSAGAIYTALERLQGKRLIDSRWGDPTPERGGRRRRYYWIEDAGREAVRRTQMVYEVSPNPGLAMGVA